jgi:trk system potassium uptake protein TrkH
LKRVRAVIYAIAQINLAILVLAFINGILFFVYYCTVGDVKGYSITVKYLFSVSLLLFLWASIAYTNRKNVIENYIDLMIAASLVWLSVPLSSTIIYLSTLKLDLLDAFFESFSGFSGTGLTILSNLDATPYVLLIWRALTQWLGELGTVVVAGVVLPYLHISLIRIYSIERGPRLVSTIRRSMIDLFAMYAAYTLLGCLILFLSGMGPLDAVIHSMTAIATGGMSSKDQNIGYWYFRGLTATLLASSIVMVIGALNFKDLYNLSKGRFKEFIDSPEVRGFFAIFTLLLIFAIIFGKAFNLNIAIVAYHIVSGYTTTGFQVGNIYVYPDALKIILILAMAIGGATFSTAGGIKTRRIVIAVKSIAWDIQRTLLPKGMIIVKRLGQEILGEDTITSAVTYIVLYTITLLLLSSTLYFILMTSNLTNYNFLDSLFEVTSALSCVGLSVGITSISLPPTAKLILITAMYLGRLEFLPLYLVIGSYYIKKKLPG